MPYGNSRTKSLTDFQKAMILVDYANPDIPSAEICRITGQAPGYLTKLKQRKQGRRLLVWAKNTGDPSRFSQHIITEQYPISHALYVLGVDPVPSVGKAMDLAQFTLLNNQVGKKDE